MKTDKERLYRVWDSMKTRCSNPRHKDAKYYYEKGVSICSDWSTNFDSFYEFAKNAGYRHGLTIDRINNEGNYEPNNCRFVERKIQTRNTRIIYSNNTSGYRGVHLHTASNKWVAKLKINGKIKLVGYFSSSLEAAIARDDFIIKNNLEHTLNFTKGE